MIPPFATAAIVDDSAAGVGLLRCLKSAGLHAVLFVEDEGAQERAAQAMKRAGHDGPQIRVGQPDGAFDVVLSVIPVSVHVAKRLTFALRDPAPDAVHVSFGAPVEVSEIVEVATNNLSPQVQNEAEAFLSQIGKTAIFAKASPDFPGQILVDAYQWAVDVLLTYHTTPWALDDAMQAAGWGIGPCLRQDAEGLDKAYARRRVRRGNPSYLPLQAVDRAVEEGRLGRQIGWGWYRYPGGGGPVEDPLVEDLLEEEAWLRKIERSELTADEMEDRIRLAVMNAAVEVVVSGQTDLDGVEILAHHLLQSPNGLGAEVQATGSDQLQEQLVRLTSELRDPWTLRWSPADWPWAK